MKTNRKSRGLLKKGAILLLLLLGMAACAGPETVGQRSEQPLASQSLPTASWQVLPTPEFTPTPEPTPTPPFPAQAPIRLRIPRIGVDGPVETVYDDEENNMMVVPGAETISWHGESPFPGYPGNSLFAAHHRWSGKQGAFARLHELVPGDVAEIVWPGDIVYTFTVRSVDIYSYFDFPMELLEFYDMPAKITLITCHGVFDKTIGTSNERVVVILDPPAY